MYKIYTRNVCTPPGYIKKLLLIMKITAIFLFAALMQVSAAGLAQRLTLVKKDATLKQVFDAVNKQTNYNFVWSADQLNINQPVNADFKDTPLLEVLDKCLSNTGMTYTIEDKTVVIKKKDESFIDKAQALFAQVAVSGKVVDETGQPMMGVTVKERNKPANATATDSKGAYTLTVTAPESVIAFTFVGYEAQELAARDLPNGSTIMMKAVVTNLHEVAISKGYYTEKQELSTADVSIVTAKEIGEQPVSDPIQALIGRVAGLNIQQTSGMPGAYAKIQIRGQNSIANGNDPLYIIDGVTFSSLSLSSTAVGIGATGSGNSLSNLTGNGLSPFNGLNPADIESIEVLKDADATAIYGSRGANGVILITTKRGKVGDTKVNFDFSQGVGQVGRFMDLLNTQQYLTMRREAFKNDGLIVPSIQTKPTDNNYDINGVWDTTRYTNWQKVMIGGNANFTNAQGSVSGGSANTQFLLGFGYTDQGTVFPGNYSDQKASAHINLTHSSQNQRFGAQFTASYVHDNNILPTSDYTSLITTAPDAPALYDKNGNVNWQVYNGNATFGLNPAGSSLATATSTTDNLISNLNLRYQILPGLELKSSFGYNHDQMNQNTFVPLSSLAPPNNTSPNSRSHTFATTYFSSWIIEPQLTYQKALGTGKLDFLAGSTFQQNQISSLTQGSNGYVSDALITNPGAASTIYLDGSNYVLYRYTAIYGRIGYNRQEKYILNLTARRDGSSRFGPGKQFGNFGAVGAAWIFFKEKFVQDALPWLSFGKLRASYGTSGNDQIQDYQFLSTYNAPYSMTYQGFTGLAPTRLTNLDFAWEVVKKLEVGLELGFLKDRINLSANYYRDRTGNQLVGLSEPYVTGFNSIQYNLPAVVQNSGVELLLNTVNVKTKDFTWTSALNLTVPSNKLVSFPNLANFAAYRNRYVVGQSLFIKKVFHNTGVNPQTGFYSFATNNTTGYPSSPQDQVVAQPVTQHYYGGFQNSFSYKAFTMDIFIQYVNQTAYGYQNAFNTPGYANYYNQPTLVLNRWQNPGALTNVQRFGTGFSSVGNPYGYFTGSDGIITGASFLRLKNVALSWQLPATWKEKIGLKNARIYVQGQNLLTITKYIGPDPETSGTLSLPPLRMVTTGLQVGL